MILRVLTCAGRLLSHECSSSCGSAVLKEPAAAEAVVVSRQTEHASACRIMANSIIMIGLQSRPFKVLQIFGWPHMHICC